MQSNIEFTLLFLHTNYLYAEYNQMIYSNNYNMQNNYTQISTPLQQKRYIHSKSTCATIQTKLSLYLNVYKLIIYFLSHMIKTTKCMYNKRYELATSQTLSFLQPTSLATNYLILNQIQILSWIQDVVNVIGGRQVAITCTYQNQFYCQKRVNSKKSCTFLAVQTKNTIRCCCDLKDGKNQNFHKKIANK
eukprot:TRINITY_DN3200_c1_g1_i2.p3 TRINITY_DN3200_c1_g1~~TRINITY_DN3200_c1_g1_i2.p3  ORF type:complete len:190 (+),score=-17.60 TRINITY_DN3200_c1_g1_i2:229-798(+)